MDCKISLKRSGGTLGILLVCIIFSVSCEKYSFRVETVDPVDTVHFNAVIRPMLDNKCSACHGGSRDPDLR